MRSLLLITENPTVRFMIKKHLSSSYSIVEANRPPPVLNALHTSSFEFVILDSCLASCTPLELAQTIRSFDPLLPILLITGRLKKSFREEALEAGVSDFLQDTLDLDELETRIAILKKTKEALQKTKEISSRIASSPPPLSKKKRKFAPTNKPLPISPQKKTKDSL